jgi:hypothetical protein
MSMRQLMYASEEALLILTGLDFNDRLVRIGDALVPPIPNRCSRH